MSPQPDAQREPHPEERSAPRPGHPSGRRPESAAARLSTYGGPESVRLDAIPVPTPSAGQVLVRVRAAGVNALDWKLREGYMREAMPLSLPATLGLELAGEVVAVGERVTRFAVGDRVLGALPGIGAYADHVTVDAAVLARTPDALTDVEAAAIPVAALTAVQALDLGALRAGQTVLIHGAAGGVGAFAVQLARARGATVVATAADSSRGYVQALGADTVIDYARDRFEEQVRDVALVLDLVGGDVPARSWPVLAPGGVLVSTVVPDVAAHAPAERRGAFLMMRPDADALATLADAVARGTLRSTIADVVAPGALPAAIERTRTGHAPGKLVVDVTPGFASVVGATTADAATVAPLPADDLHRTLTIARPESDQTLTHVGVGTGTYTILVSGRETAGRYTLIDMLVPPGGGPPPHRHDFEEMFTIVEGEVAVTFRGETTTVRRGETINVPANAPHAFRNVSDTPARLLCMCTPAGQEEFFLVTGVRLPTRTSPPPIPDPATRAASIAKAVALAPRYHSELLIPPARA